MKKGKGSPHSDFKDLFSLQSADYSRYRPSYPQSLFEYLSSLVQNHSLAWDVGTGSGQAAVALADFFDEVLGTDPSAKQILNGKAHSKVEYRVGLAEKSGLANSSVDLITAAQAFHWFKHDDFFAEAQRVLKPGGVLALWSYNLVKITPEVDEVILELYQNILGKFWEPERRLVEEGYGSIDLPFEKIVPPPFKMTAMWMLDHLIGYLNTWSALQRYRNEKGTDPLQEIHSELKAAWGQRAERLVSWDLSLKLGRKPTTRF